MEAQACGTPVIACSRGGPGDDRGGRRRELGGSNRHFRLRTDSGRPSSSGTAVFGLGRPLPPGGAAAERGTLQPGAVFDVLHWAYADGPPGSVLRSAFGVKALKRLKA